MIEHLTAQYPSLLVPLALAIGMTYLVKAMYAVHGSFSQRRKEFIEHWQKDRIRDDLWLEMMIRQTFGKYIPADIVRLLIASPDCARALSEVAAAWKFVKYERGAVSWRNSWMNSRRKRVWSIRLLNTAYFLSAGGAGLALLAVITGTAPFTAWIWLPSLLVLAFFTLNLSVEFGTASKVVPSRLGLS